MGKDGGDVEGRKLENCHFRSFNFCCTPSFMAAAADHATEKSNSQVIKKD
jgi:hypothetical protein